jgi:hypothetical protein
MDHDSVGLATDEMGCSSGDAPAPTLPAVANLECAAPCPCVSAVATAALSAVAARAVLCCAVLP